MILEGERALSFRTSKVLFVLIIWFWVWGICPWDSSSAATPVMQGVHAQHGHQAAGETHHASKGGEHSCANPTLYSSSQFQKDGHLFLIDGPFSFTAVLWNLMLSADLSGYLPSSFQPRTFLPKLLTEYYQLYSIYRL